MPTFDIYEELWAILRALESRQLDYALCGAVALAVHGRPRATTDIDMLVAEDHVADVKAVLRGLGYDLEAAPMTFSSGIRVHRVSRVEGTELMTVDLLVTSAALQAIWDTRLRLTWRDAPMHVVSREGLITMKRIANRLQDRADLEALGATGDDYG